MNNQEKIAKLEEVREVQWKHLQICKNQICASAAYGLKKETEEAKHYAELARARWAQTNRIIKFLKDEIDETELF